jgi:PHD/YefM family antitoxin component YafN of YafNO toxin-antitoxin module
MTILNDTDDEKDAISETQYLLDIPGMRESILEGMGEDLDECCSKLEW